MTENLDELRKTAEAATSGPWDLYSTQDYEVFCAANFTDSNYEPPAVTYGSDRSEDAEFIATFDPPTVLELIERAEAAERALDFHSQRDRELKTTLSMISDRLDEHSYDELSSLIEDEPLDQWGETYKSRLEQAEQAVQRVREVASEYRPSIPEEVLHEVMKDILRALDGHTKQLGGTPTGELADVCSCGKSYWPCTALDGDGRG